MFFWLFFGLWRKNHLFFFFHILFFVCLCRLLFCFCSHLSLWGFLFLRFFFSYFCFCSSLFCSCYFLYLLFFCFSFLHGFFFVFTLFLLFWCFFFFNFEFLFYFFGTFPLFFILFWNFGFFGRIFLWQLCFPLDVINYSIDINCFTCNAFCRVYAIFSINKLNNVAASMSHSSITFHSDIFKGIYETSLHVT